MADEAARKDQRASSLGAVPVLVLLLLAVAVGFWLVGWLAAREDAHGFDWELASIFGTAVGTTLLALGTGWLAYSTRKLAQLTRRDQAARDRPTVLVEDARYAWTGATGTLEVQLMNVGLGPALRVRIEAAYVGPGPAPTIHGWTVPVVAPGARSSPSLLVVSPAPPADTAAVNFKVSGTYLDRSRDNEYAIIIGE